ncbi:MAG: insulinase family protein [Dehalococcoidia bacterium]|nr:insulinase family protein [Dehalococcoidia bacterium]
MGDPGFHGPAFSDTEKDYAALDLLLDLYFGPTSELYRRLVEREQVVDQLIPYFPAHQDPYLASVFARLKDPKDAAYVRARMLETISEARSKRLADTRVGDAKSFQRYGFVRTLDNSESIASTLAQFVRFDRDYDTLNRLFQVYEALTPADLVEAGERYLADNRMVQTTPRHASRPGLDVPPAIPEPRAHTGLGMAPERIVEQRSESPLVRFKLLFETGSADDPAGKEGLAALAAEMAADAGSKSRTIDEINDLLFPMAGSFEASTDREMTVFTGVIHRDLFDRFVDIVLEQLTAPGLREEDFDRLKSLQMNALVQDLRSSNEEELGKERLQETVYTGTPYGHPVIGTVSGIEAITREDVASFQREHFTRSRLRVGLAGGYSDAERDRLLELAGELPEGSPPNERAITPRQPSGLEVEVIQKETRATAISVGHPLTVTRGHPDWPALWLARAWFGEHRASARDVQPHREVRGMTTGQWTPTSRRSRAGCTSSSRMMAWFELFEVRLRPLVPELYLD